MSVRVFRLLSILKPSRLFVQTRFISKKTSRLIFPPLYRVDFNKRIHLSSAVFEEKIVKVPPFPESVKEGDIRWEKKVGDTVQADEVVCEIETDKTAVPVHSPQAGVIMEIYAEDGSSVKDGQKLFKLKVGGEGGAPKAAEKAPKAEAPPKAEVKAPKAEVKAPKAEVKAPKAEKPKAAEKPPKEEKPEKEEPTKPAKAPKPKAEKMEAPKQEGSSKSLMKVPPKDPTKAIHGTRSESRVKMNRIRQRIAQRLKDAQNTNAMLTTFNELDMSSIIEFRKVHQDAFSRKYGVKLGFMSAFIKASANALQDQPTVNAVIDESEIIYRDYIDISVAVATPKGLLVPVIRNVDSMNYGEIEIAIHELGEKARVGKLSVEDMDGGTFTISNGGVFGSLMGTPIINPPQSAILGMHGTFERPVAIKGQVVIRPMMYIALTYDHRLVDGREAVLFLKKIKQGVEDPRIILAGI